MRLMFSQDQAEIESVRNELLKAGIVAVARKHPVAEDLGVPGLELWVQDERDFFNASNLYARIQDDARMKGSNTAGGPARKNGIAKPPVVHFEASATHTGNTDRARRPVNDANASPNTDVPHHEDLEEASSVLEQEIEEMLQRENALLAECGFLRNKARELTRAFSEGQAALAREAEARAAAEKKQAEAISRMESALKCERAGRSFAEEQLARERNEWHQQLQAKDEMLKESQQELESKSQLLSAQETEMADLRKEIVDLGARQDEAEKLLCELRTEAALQREARAVAEERAERALAEQGSLTQQLLEQKELEQKLQTHVASINSLCNRLHAKRFARAEP